MKDDVEFVWLKGEMYVRSNVTYYFYTREEIEAAYLVYCSVLAKVSHVSMEDSDAWLDDFRRMKAGKQPKQPRWERHAVRALDVLFERWDPEAPPKEPWPFTEEDAKRPPAGTEDQTGRQYGQCAHCILPAYGCVVCAPFEPSPDADDSSER